MMHKNQITVYYILTFIFFTVTLEACIEDTVEKHGDTHFLQKSYISILPREITHQILSFLEKQELLCLRQVGKPLKNAIESTFLLNNKINIKAEYSSPAIEEVKDFPATLISLYFESWKQEDIEKLLFFKNTINLSLGGLQSWDFSTGKLFNPSFTYSYIISPIISFVNFTSFNFIRKKVFDTPSIFSAVTSLDLSESRAGDYGVICFVSNFKKLKILNISGNNIGCNIIGEVDKIFELQTLTSLDISKNRFSNESIENIIKLIKLNFLNISYNNINNDLVITKLRQMPNLNNFININNM